ncbi:MAG: iron-containing alcohol dehydrogenase [Clostridia bacterium]|nr:iron-containing alcohol dehydrogenase [Clostridia bacterium]
MLNFTFYSPTYFVFGKDTECQSGEYVRKFGGSRVLIHYGGGSVVRSGLLARVEQSLTDAGVTFVELGGVMPNPRSGLVYEGIELCKREKVDFVLAVGGGSVIDSAKAIALGSCYDGDFWDFYEDRTRTASATALPVGVVLTIAAAGSEGSSDSVITKEEGMLKRATGGDCLRPKFSILNPALTQTLPPYQTASGATDIMAHVFERYFTNTTHVETTDRLCEAVLMAMIHEVPKVIADPNDYEARANIMWAGMVAHNDICGVGREQDWNSHWLEHEISAVNDCAHGAGLAVVMPAWMEYVVDHDVMRFAQVATRVWGCSMDYADPRATAMAGIEAFRNFLRSIGMPTTMAELGAKEEDIPYFVKTLGLNGGETGGFVHLKDADAEAIYRLACK